VGVTVAGTAPAVRRRAQYQQLRGVTTTKSRPAAAAAAAAASEGDDSMMTTDVVDDCDDVTADRCLSHVDARRSVSRGPASAVSDCSTAQHIQII